MARRRRLLWVLVLSALGLAGLARAFTPTVPDVSGVWDLQGTFQMFCSFPDFRPEPPEFVTMRVVIQQNGPGLVGSFAGEGTFAGEGPPPALIAGTIDENGAIFIRLFFFDARQEGTFTVVGRVNGTQLALQVMGVFPPGVPCSAGGPFQGVIRQTGTIPTPTPVASPTPRPSPTPTPVPTPTPRPSPTPTPVPSPTPRPTPTPLPTPTPVPIPLRTIDPRGTVPEIRFGRPTPTPTPGPTVTPSPSPAPSPTPTASPSPSPRPSPAPSPTPTPAPTPTPDPSPTPTPAEVAILDTNDLLPTGQTVQQELTQAATALSGTTDVTVQQDPGTGVTTLAIADRQFAFWPIGAALQVRRPLTRQDATPSLTVDPASGTATIISPGGVQLTVMGVPPNLQAFLQILAPHGVTGAQVNPGQFVLNTSNPRLQFSTRLSFEVTSGAGAPGIAANPDGSVTITYPGGLRQQGFPLFADVAGFIDQVTRAYPGVQATPNLDGTVTVQAGEQALRVRPEFTVTGGSPSGAKRLVLGESPGPVFDIGDGRRQRFTILP
jgi:hypothetical protein